MILFKAKLDQILSSKRQLTASDGALLSSYIEKIEQFSDLCSAKELADIEKTLIKVRERIILSIHATPKLSLNCVPTMKLF